MRAIYLMHRDGMRRGDRSSDVGEVDGGPLAQSRLVVRCDYAVAGWAALSVLKPLLLGSCGISVYSEITGRGSGAAARSAHRRSERTDMALPAGVFPKHAIICFIICRLSIGAHRSVSETKGTCVTWCR